MPTLWGLCLGGWSWKLPLVSAGQWPEAIGEEARPLWVGGQGGLRGPFPAKILSSDGELIPLQGHLFSHTSFPGLSFCWSWVCSLQPPVRSWSLLRFVSL